MSSPDLGRLALDESAHYLRDVHLPRLRRALEVLPDADLWWRPHADSLSAATILLHLEGNVRQWVLSGLGGAPDRRDRAAEFAAHDGPAADELFAALSDTVTAAGAVIEALDPDALTEPVTIQGFETTPFAALYHVVEHFSWHTGQLVQMAKQRAGVAHGLSFYDTATINAARNAGGADA